MTEQDAILIGLQIYNNHVSEEDMVKLADGLPFGKVNEDVFIEYIKTANKALAKQMNSGWIKCSERLPNSDCDILCFVEMKRRGSECTFRRIVKWDCKYKDWKYENGAYIADYYKVIAWQRLVYPEPYKAGEDNE